jgi:predicted dehydrogenase
MSNIKVIMLGTSHPHIFHRYRYLQRSPNITPLGYYDSDAEVAQRMQGHAGCTRYENLDSLLALPYDVAAIVKMQIIFGWP